MEDKEKSSRVPFSAFEKEFIKELIAPHLSVLESKKTNSHYANEKKLIWDKIAQQFNDCDRTTEATSKQIKKAWLNMKSRARDAKSLELQRLHTGGGPPIKDMDPEDEAVLSLIPNVLPRVKVIRDSDGPGGENDDDDFCQRQPKTVEIDDVMIVDATNIKVTSNESSKNEKNKETKKNPKLKLESIDNLKRKIVENDIKYREERHSIEIEHLKKKHAAELEILALEKKYKEKLIELAEVEHKIRKRSI